MNCIARRGLWRYQRKQAPITAFSKSILALVAACGLLSTVSCSATDTPDEATSSEYSLHYRVVPLLVQNEFQVELTLDQSSRLLRELKMRVPGRYFSEFTGDGDILVENGEIVWNPPKKGGVLSWRVQANRPKANNRYDAYMSDSWAVFRASDIIPPAGSRTAKGATSKTTLTFDLPTDWSSVTQYAGQNNHYRIDNPARRFDRPTGWVLLGRIGVRTERIADIQLKIAAPKNHDTRRMDMLALLSWTLPEAVRLFPELPTRITVISANDPMWRGGLSAPSSLYIHASLPLISENGTSTLLHEVVHIGMRASAADNADWIIEGLAEYYGLQLLLRSGTITEERYGRALDSLKSWGKEARTLCGDFSSGAVTARSTILMHEIDQEIRRNSNEEYNLDDVMNALSEREQKIRITDFANAVTDVLSAGSEILDAAGLDDCES
jgi:hypothetical protein